MSAQGLTSECDVAIVGAGVAGLAAMRVVEEQGLRACVLEARARVGGRIYTVRDPRLAHPTSWARNSSTAAPLTSSISLTTRGWSPILSRGSDGICAADA